MTVLAMQGITAKCHPNNDVGIHLGEFSWRMLPPCCWLQHYANTDSFRHKQGASHYSGSTRSSILRKSCWEKCCQFEQKTWLKCMLFTDKPDFNCFEYKIWKLPCHCVLICWKFENKQTLLPNGFTWIPAILLCVQRYNSLKGKHSCSCDCNHPNTIFVWI